MSRLWRNSNNLCNNGAERTIVQGKSTTALTRGTRVQQVLHPYFCARELRVVISCRIDKRLLQVMATAVVLCSNMRQLPARPTNISTSVTSSRRHERNRYYCDRLRLRSLVMSYLRTHLPALCICVSSAPRFWTLREAKGGMRSDRTWTSA